MSYRSKTPAVISILQRRLKPGKTFEDFQQAHLPTDDAKKNEFGYETEHFSVPTRVINAISAEDPSIVYSIGLSYGDVDTIFEEAMNKSEEDSQPGRRKEKLNDVCDTLAFPIIAFVGSDNDYGGKSEEYEQTPLPELTPEITEAIQTIKAISSKPNDEK